MCVYARENVRVYAGVCALVSVCVCVRVWESVCVRVFAVKLTLVRWRRCVLEGEPVPIRAE